MKLFKRKILTNSSLSAFAEYLKPVSDHFNEKFRLPARIRIANMWASKHPRSFTFISVGALLLVFVFDLVFSFGNVSKEKDSASNIVSMEPVLSPLRGIQNIKKVQSASMQELAHESVSIKRELDSLIALPEKTHEDSMQIRKKYRQVSIIVENLNMSKNEKN